MARFSISERLKSFKYAFNGLRIVLNQHNFWIHILAAIIAILLGIYYQISISEWIAITLCIALVFAAEILNTAIELLADLIDKNYNEKIGMVKDLAAGAVLIISIAAAIVGGLIFIPKLV